MNKMKETDKKLKVLFWIITLITPLIILILLEGGLRLLKYDESKQNLFIQLPNNPQYVIANPNFVTRYFPSFSPKIAPIPFLKEKPDDVYRIFVLGGSSTEGFPYNFYNSFSSRMQQKFNLETQGIRVEVINLGMTAVNSFVIWDMRKKIAKYEPDAVVLYAGHNEYYGSFGVGSKQYALGNSISLKRLILRLKGFYLYQWLEGLVQQDNPVDSDRTMMSLVVKDSQIEYQSEVFKEGLDQFKINITDFIEFYAKKGTSVYIGSLASNLKDQKPLGENSNSVEAYMLGSKLLSEGKKDSALIKFKEAKDLDEIRFRAPSSINKIIKDIAEKTNSFFVDIEQVALENAKEGIPGEDLFIDHLHPNWRLNQLIGEEFFKNIIRNKKIQKYYLPNELSTIIDISQFEKTYASIAADRLESGYPFEKGLTSSQEASVFKKKYEKYLSLSFEDSLAARTWLELKPVSSALRRVVQRDIELRDTLALVKNSIALKNWFYFNEELLKVGISHSVNSRKLDDYNVTLLHSILNLRREDTYFANLLAGIYMVNKDFKRAKYWLSESESIEPNSSELLLNYSRYYILQGDTLRATSYLRKYRSSINR
ncbi:MAG: SGNH/GDSL hydrolase family protein [Balneola sp.]